VAGRTGFEGNIEYFLQAVDNNGNVGMVTLSGQDLAEGGTPYGSTWSGPKTYGITLGDSDSDGMPDAYEAQHACLVNGNDSAADPDYDTLSNLQEFGADTNPCVGDSDGGGDNDGSEKTRGRNPLNKNDDKQLTITVARNGNNRLIGWPVGSGDNSVMTAITSSIAPPPPSLARRQDQSSSDPIRDNQL